MLFLRGSLKVEVSQNPVGFGKPLAVSRLKAAKHAFLLERAGVIPKNPPFGGGALGRNFYQYINCGV